MTSGQPRSRSARPRCQSLDEALAWIAAEVTPLPPETVPLSELCGRVLAADVVAPADEPLQTRAARDGLAVRADDLMGAAAYNPLSFRLSTGAEALGAGEAAPVNAGDPVPRGSDAVVPFDYVHRSCADQCEVIDVVPSGYAIETVGSHVRRGVTIFSAGRQLNAPDIGILAQLGIGSTSVIRRPGIGLVLVGRDLVDPNDQSAKGALWDVDGLMLQRLIERDGGSVVFHRRIDRDVAALRAALAESELDATFVVGGTGSGPDDHSSAILADVGDVAVGEIALYPGGSAALGRTAHHIPVCLLPGRPSACLWAYEIVVGGVVRRLGGREPALPFQIRSLTLTRKIVSTIGTTEIWPVRLTDMNQAEPVISAPQDSLLALASADGFIIVPEASEGIPAGATAKVYLRGSCR
jgi:molybdopterin molybdotransferase